MKSPINEARRAAFAPFRRESSWDEGRICCHAWRSSLVEPKRVKARALPKELPRPTYHPDSHQVAREERSACVGSAAAIEQQASQRHARRHFFARAGMVSSELGVELERLLRVAAAARVVCSGEELIRGRRNHGGRHVHRLGRPRARHRDGRRDRGNHDGRRVRFFDRRWLFDHRRRGGRLDPCNGRLGFDGCRRGGLCRCGREQALHDVAPYRPERGRGTRGCEKNDGPHGPRAPPPRMSAGVRRAQGGGDGSRRDRRGPAERLAADTSDERIVAGGGVALSGEVAHGAAHDRTRRVEACESSRRSSAVSVPSCSRSTRSSGCTSTGGSYLAPKSSAVGSSRYGGAAPLVRRTWPHRVDGGPWRR